MPHANKSAVSLHTEVFSFIFSRNSYGLDMLGFSVFPRASPTDSNTDDHGMI